METSIQEVNSLDSLAENIKREHSLVEESAKSSITHALKVGEYLVRAKAMMKFGFWSAWVEKECEVNIRSAQGYIRLFNKVGSDPQRVAHLSLREALRFLVDSPKTKEVKSEKETSDSIEIKFPVDSVELAMHVWAAGYKAMAMKNHPDHGGDEKEMQRLNSLHAGIELQLLQAVKAEGAAAD